MNMTAKVINYIEENEQNGRQKQLYLKYINIMINEMNIDFDAVTVDEQTVLEQKGIFYRHHKNLDITVLWNIIKRAYFIKYGTAPKEERITWNSGSNSSILCDCVVEIVLKYADKSILASLDGFTSSYELKDPRLQEMVELILKTMGFPAYKTGAIHAQLSIIGCAFNKAMGFNKQAYDKYRKYINEKLTTSNDSLTLDADEVNLFEIELNEGLTVYTEGAITEVFLKRRNRNRKARLKILERDEYTCQSCGLNPIDYFKHTLHVHHISPLHLASQERHINFNQLITLCPTCHGYIHARKNPLSIDEVKDLLELRKNYLD